VRPASEQLSQPGGLAERLTALRNAAGLKATQLAESLGWARSKVSKIENGNQVPTDKDIREWTSATGHPEVTEELIAMLRQVQEVHTRWRRRLREGGQASVQRELDELTRAASRIRNLQIAIIPGLLQTAGYAHGIATQVAAVYGNVDVDAAVAARIKRQEILYETGEPRQFEFVFTEAALYMPPCPRAAMLGQLDRLMAMDLANITLGIIPMGTELSMSPLNSFMLLDDLLVVESYGYEDRVGGDLADTHARIFDMLMTESATSEAARRLITKAAASLRQELGKPDVRVIRPAADNDHLPQPETPDRLENTRRIRARRCRDRVRDRLPPAVHGLQKHGLRATQPDKPGRPARAIRPGQWVQIPERKDRRDRQRHRWPDAIQLDMQSGYDRAERTRSVRLSLPTALNHLRSSTNSPLLAPSGADCCMRWHRGCLEPPLQKRQSSPRTCSTHCGSRSKLVR
jgi:transcriptional regulator with XRE-family HTH domain